MTKKKPGLYTTNILPTRKHTICDALDLNASTKVLVLYQPQKPFVIKFAPATGLLSAIPCTRKKYLLDGDFNSVLLDLQAFVNQSIASHTGATAAHALIIPIFIDLHGKQKKNA